MRLTPASCSAEILAYFSRSNFSQKSLYSRLQSVLVWATAETVIRPGAATTERARTAHARRFISGSPYLSSDGTPVARCDQIRGHSHKVSKAGQKSAIGAAGWVTATVATSTPHAVPSTMG